MARRSIWCMHIACWFARVKRKKGAKLGALYECHPYFIIEKRKETVASANLPLVSVCRPRKTV